MEYGNLFNYLDSIQVNYSENEPLCNHCSFKIGGPCDVFIDIRSENELAEVLKFCGEEYNLLIIGNGSNLLIDDNGYRGVVIHLANAFSNIEAINDCELQVCAGAPLSAVCNFALSLGLSGLEFAYGIPGTLGGAVYMNAGAYGGEMAQVVKKVNYLTREGKRGSFSSGELQFSYRHSIFTENDYIITSAVIKLTPSAGDKISSLMRENMLKRKTKQPLEFPSAGSVFKRPKGYFTGVLIEESGLKGYTIGGAQVSKKHAGFIINVGGATCKDVLMLIDHIKKTVFDNYKVKLETEIKYIC